MQKQKHYYITTTLPYVNGLPHIGFALEIIEADVLARYHRLLGYEVTFNTGTDEHGVNIHRQAQQAGKDPKTYVDEMSQHFRNLKKVLNLSTTHFIRTTDEDHILAAQEFWRRSEAQGDIYKKAYRIKYCTGCELEKTESELDENGRCLLHPSKEVEIMEEENYFFRWSKYQGALLELYRKQPDFVIPRKRLNEIQSFVEQGLQDFSISRLREKLPWGVPVPGDDSQVMYVWFDALINYISTLGWPANQQEFEKRWPGIQIAGKDNVRQQAAMWQAMLHSAGLPYSRQILINGFINVGGQKMSKSLGNIIRPEELVKKFGIDGARYLLLTLAHIGEDSDITWESASEKFNAHLANGLGNLLSRVVKLSEKLSAPYSPKNPESFDQAFRSSLEKYRFSEALELIWQRIGECNKYIDEEKPWELSSSDPERFASVLHKLLSELSAIAFHLQPFLPETAEKIDEALKAGETEPLFQRL